MDPITALKRGLLVGLLAGLAAGIFGFAFGEPTLQRAIDLEEANAAQVDTAASTADHDHAAGSTGHSHDAAAAAGGSGGEAAGGHSHGEGAEVSRPVQRGGLIVATTLSGGIFGGLLLLAWSLRARRRPQDDPWRSAVAVGLAAAWAFVLVPAVVAPTNPPGVGDPDTITQRTIAYLVAVAGGLAGAWLASRIARVEAVQAERWRAALAVVVTGLATLGLLALVLPAPEAAPSWLPAQTLWNFRLSSIGTQIVLWTGLVIGVGAMASRSQASRAGARASASSASLSST